MPAHGEYALHEFLSRLAAVEEKFAEELKSVIECFIESSVYAVDTDNAMREVRKSLRKIIVKAEKQQEKEKAKDFQLTVNGSQYIPSRRLGDEYRPQSFLSSLTKRKPKPTPSERIQLPTRAPSPHSHQIQVGDTNLALPEHEIYDKHRPSLEEAQRARSTWRKSLEEETQESTAKNQQHPFVPSSPIDQRPPQPAVRSRSHPGQPNKLDPTITLPPSFDHQKVPYLPQPDYDGHQIPPEPEMIKDRNGSTRLRDAGHTPRPIVRRRSSSKVDQEVVARPLSDVEKPKTKPPLAQQLTDSTGQVEG
ncbi:unnamed protein product, partial [Mesorhabditis spiculigera]